MARDYRLLSQSLEAESSNRPGASSEDETDDDLESQSFRSESTTATEDNYVLRLVGAGGVAVLSGKADFGDYDGTGAAAYLDEWYRRFTLFHTLRYVVKVSAKWFILYLSWSLISIYFKPEWLKDMEDEFVLKVLCFLVGFLISLTLTESLSRFKECLSALVDFREEFQAFWYFASIPLMDRPAARLLLDVHMVVHAIGLARYILRGYDVKSSQLLGMVHPYLRPCILFSDEGTYGSITSNPAYTEILLVYWMRSMGVLDSDLRRRLTWARSKIDKLLRAQRVRTPRTSSNLLAMVLHLLLFSVPICTGSTTTKLLLPMLASITFSIVSLADELEDPFGFDEHDLPWPVIFKTITCCPTPLQQGEAFISEVLTCFNEACKFSWDPKKVHKLFGPRAAASIKTGHGPTIVKPSDSGRISLSLYPTEAKLRQLDVIGNSLQGLGNPDDLFTTPAGDEDRATWHAAQPFPGDVPSSYAALPTRHNGAAAEAEASSDDDQSESDMD